MIDALVNIWGMLAELFFVIVNFFESLLFVINFLISSITVPLGLIGYVPSVLASSIIIVVALAVVKMILGR